MSPVVMLIAMGWKCALLSAELAQPICCYKLQYAAHSRYTVPATATPSASMFHIILQER